MLFIEFKIEVGFHSFNNQISNLQKNTKCFYFTEAENLIISPNPI